MKGLITRRILLKVQHLPILREHWNQYLCSIVKSYCSDMKYNLRQSFAKMIIIHSSPSKWIEHEQGIFDYYFRLQRFSFDVFKYNLQSIFPMIWTIPKIICVVHNTPLSAYSFQVLDCPIKQEFVFRKKYPILHSIHYLYNQSTIDRIRVRHVRIGWKKGL